MNSSYVKTDEEQRRWSPRHVYEQPLRYGEPAVGLGATEAQYCPDGYPQHPNQQSYDLRLYDRASYEIRYQQQPGLTWSDPSLDVQALDLESVRSARSSSAWTFPHATAPPSVGFSVPHYPQSMPLQGASFLSTQPLGYFDISPSSQYSNALTPFIDVDLGSKLNDAELVRSPSTVEERVFTPPMGPGIDGTMPRQQSPRFVGDEYAASWVRGSGVERVGWCGFCPTWHRLKDSAYWYHVCDLRPPLQNLTHQESQMHYSHGISCVTGKPFKGTHVKSCITLSTDVPLEPKDWRHKHGITAYEALCGGCDKWVYIGRPERWRTPYFRHGKFGKC